MTVVLKSNEEHAQVTSKIIRINATRNAMLELIKTTNVMGFDEDIIQGMTEALQESHRTLQQSFMRCFVGTMDNYSKSRTDARNKNAVEFAKKVSEMEAHFPFI